MRRRNIPYYVVKGRGFFGCQEVRDIINFLKYLDGENDDVALVGILRSPLVGISDETLYWLFKEAGNDLFLIGETKAELGGSEYHSVIYGLEGGIPPKVDEVKIKATWDFLFELYRNGIIKTNHDVNKGGFIITIAEMSFKNNLGAELDLTDCFDKILRDDEVLFSESYGRFIIETPPNSVNKILEIANKHRANIIKIGTLTPKPEINLCVLSERSQLTNSFTPFSFIYLFLFGFTAITPY